MTHMANIKNERGDITVDPIDIKIKIKKYYTYKFDNLYEMYQFPERHTPPTLTQEQTETLNKLYLLKNLNQ